MRVLAYKRYLPIAYREQDISKLNQPKYYLEALEPIYGGATAE